MKEATGELNMTVVTLIAIAAIAGLFYFAIWPMVQQMLVQQTCNTYGPDYKAVKGAKQYGDSPISDRDDLIKYLEDEYQKYCKKWGYSIHSEYKIIDEDEWEKIKN